MKRKLLPMTIILMVLSTITLSSYSAEDAMESPNREKYIEKVIELGSSNSDLAHAILTGENVPDILGSGYNADTALMPLLQRDDGKAMASLTDWIARDAKTNSPEGTPEYEKSERAGSAARGLAEIMTSTESSDGTNNYATLSSGARKIGAGSAVQAAEALAPFVGDMVGLFDDLTQTNGFGKFGGSRDYIGGPVEPLRVFSILDTDDEASQIINGAAITEGAQIDRLFAETGYASLGDFAYRLQWLVVYGFNTEIGQRVQDGVDRRKAQNSMLSAAWTVGQIVAGRLVPGGVAVAGSVFPRPHGLFVDDGDVPRPPERTLDATQFGFDTEGEEYSASLWGNADFRRHRVLGALVDTGAVRIEGIPQLYKSVDGADLLPYYGSVKNLHDVPYRTSLEAQRIAAQVIESAGILNIDEYSHNAVGVEQKYALLAAIFPGDDSSREGILQWLASKGSALGPNNSWQTGMFG